MYTLGLCAPRENSVDALLGTSATDNEKGTTHQPHRSNQNGKHGKPILIKIKKKHHFGKPSTRVIFHIYIGMRLLQKKNIK